MLRTNMTIFVLCTKVGIWSCLWCLKPGFNAWPGHCVVLLGKTLTSYSASLHTGVQMGTGELKAGGNPATAVWTSIPSRGE